MPVPIAVEAMIEAFEDHYGQRKKYTDPPEWFHRESSLEWERENDNWYNAQLGAWFFAWVAAEAYFASKEVTK